MKKEIFVITIVMGLIGLTPIQAQPSLNVVSLSVGTIRTLFHDQPMYRDHQYAVYPEIQIGGDFLTPSVRWVVAWAYWSDGVEEAFPAADFITYSYSSHILAGRFHFLPANLLPGWPIPVGVFAGVGHHFIAGTYVGGFGIDGRPGQDFTADATTLEVGVNAEVKVLGPIFARAEVQQFIPLGSGEFDRLQKNRRAFKIGLTLAF